MALNEMARNAFIDAYTKALVSSWSSEEFAARLESNPRAAFAEVGLELPAGAEIDIVRNATPAELDPQGSLERQVGLYEQGLETGRFEFHMPATPQIDTADMSPEELADIAAGGTYCCCCPCCCCS